MKKQATSQTSKLSGIFVTLVAIFLSLVFALQTYAWLCAERETESGGMAVSVDPSSGIALGDVMILKREGGDKAKDLADVGEGEEIGDIAISEYDAVFTDRNVNTPIIIKSKVSNLPQDEDGNYVKFSFELYYYHKGPWNDGGKLTHYLSNIVGVRCRLGDDTINSLTDCDEIYSSAVDYLAPTTEQTFVHAQKVGTSYELQSKQDFLKFEFAPADYVGYIKNGELSLYIELNYSKELLDVYSALNGIEVGQSSDGSIDDRIRFEGDLSTFIFKDGV